MATANATVMFTDIRGFTARTSRDTREGLEELLQTHEDLLIPVIKHYDGRVVKTIGDAFLVVFESPTNAVLCGVMIQRRLREFNETVPEAKRIEVRVAINSGEVTLRGDDIFGEPVNIAARIEGITEPNAIYFTEATYLTMQKAEVPSSEVGSRRLKGIPEEVKVYRVIQDEDNQLYRAILAQAEIAEDDAAEVVGSLSVPQWPPPRGRLKGPRKSAVPLVLVTLAVVLVVVAYLAFQSYREAHRYDATRAALEAKDWPEAQRLAGELWGQRGDDQEAIRLLTEAIALEIDDLAAEGNPQALQDAWTARKLAWGNLPARTDLERRVAVAKLGMQIDAGDAAGALDALHQLHEADMADAEVSALIVRAARQILVIDFASVRDSKTLDGWTKRFGDLSERYGNLPGFDAVRADAAYGMGMALTASENNFWKDAGIQLFRTFLQESPDDRERAFRVRVRLVSLRRWHGDPRQLQPYLEEDPSRAKQAGVREAILDFLSHSYDLTDEEDVAARNLLWTYWGKDVLETLHAWIESENDKERLNAFVLLREKGRLRDDEADRVLAWILLQARSGRDAEMKFAVDHWSAVPEARAKAAVPDPVPQVEALNRGASDDRWLEVVASRFYPQVEKALLAAVVESRYAGERKASREILKRREALTPALASASHLADLRQSNHDAPNYVDPSLLEAVAYFASATREELHDLDAIEEALTELGEIVGEKIASLGLRAKAWRDLQAQVVTALANLDP